MILAKNHWKTLMRGLVVATIGTLALTGQTWADDDDTGRPGAVYTSTNAAGGNQIVVFKRDANGALAPAGNVSTTGLGSGGGLGNQGALALTKNGRWLFAVNAGSNDISAFKVRPNGLTLVSKTPSGGTRPVSLTVHDDLLYVLNAGGVNNISGFTIGESGALTPIPDSTKPLSTAATGPAQIEFNRDGELLVVTEKATNKISTYTVVNGIANGPIVRDSNGATPFGFAFDKLDHLIVSEAFGGAPNGSALSSYDVNDDTGALQVISGSIGTKQTAACWVVITKNGRYAYTTNTGSGSISGYRVTRDGKLNLLNADGLTAVIGAGSGPTDAALSRGSQFLYVITPPLSAVSAFRVEANGSLTSLPGASGISNTATGLVAR